MTPKREFRAKIPFLHTMRVIVAGSLRTFSTLQPSRLRETHFKKSFFLVVWPLRGGKTPWTTKKKKKYFFSMISKKLTKTSWNTRKTEKGFEKCLLSIDSICISINSECFKNVWFLCFFYAFPNAFSDISRFKYLIFVYK